MRGGISTVVYTLMVRLLQTPHSGSTRRLRGRSVVIGFLASRYVSSRTLTARFPFLHDTLLTSPSDPESKLGTDYSSTSHCASTTTSSVTGMIASLGKETNFLARLHGIRLPHEPSNQLCRFTAWQ